MKINSQSTPYVIITDLNSPISSSNTVNIISQQKLKKYTGKSLHFILSGAKFSLNVSMFHVKT